MHVHSTLRALGVLVVAGGLIASSGCSDTTLVGQADDSEIRDPLALPFVGLGQSREINDLIFANLDEFTHLSGMTDNHVNVNNDAGANRRSIGDIRRDNSGSYEQIHEAVWTALKGVDLALGVLTDDEAHQNLIVARSWLNAGFMDRVMADVFCEATYQYGPFGGFNLPDLNDWDGTGRDQPVFDRSVIISKDSVYKRAAYSFQQAIDVAEAAIQDSVQTPSEDPGYFNADSLRMSGYAGLAQAHASLAQLGVDPAANWAAAAAAAAEVETGHIEWWDTQDDLRENQGHQEMWDDNHITIWSGIHEDPEGNQTLWGAALTQVLETGDPRSEVMKCLEWVTNVGTEEEVFGTNFAPFDDYPNTVNGPDVAACEDGNDGDDDVELGGVPRWIDARWNVDGRFAPVAAVRGTGVRLIEAEAALFNNNLPLFTQKINEVRDFYGAPQILQPATAGALEYPNELDDGWSLLDAEVLLDTWGELRRLAYMHNWEHPFITENKTTLPLYRDLLEAEGASFQRASCFPLPESECALNKALNCPNIG